MYADFAVRHEILQHMPVWAEEIPDKLDHWTRQSYMFRRGEGNQRIYRLGEYIGEGSTGTVMELNPVDNKGPHLVLKDFWNKGSMKDEIAQSDAAQADMCTVTNRSQLVMRRGIPLDVFLEKHSFMLDEVMAMITAVLNIQEHLIKDRECVYTDVKCNNVILFRCPDAEGYARVTFCDYGGLFSMDRYWNLDGISTYPPPETGYCGWLRIKDKTEAVASAVWWCGVLFLEVFQMLDWHYLRYIVDKDKEKSLAERTAYIEEVRATLTSKKLHCIASALSPNWKDRLTLSQIVEY